MRVSERASNWRILSFVVLVCDAKPLAKRKRKKINSYETRIKSRLFRFGYNPPPSPVIKILSTIDTFALRHRSNPEISRARGEASSRSKASNLLVAYRNYANRERKNGSASTLASRRREKERERRIDRSKLATRTELEHARSRSYLSWLCQARWASLRSRGSRLRLVRRIKSRRRPPVYRMQQDWQPP